MRQHDGRLLPDKYVRHAGSITLEHKYRTKRGHLKLPAFFFVMTISVSALAKFVISHRAKVHKSVDFTSLESWPHACSDQVGRQASCSAKRQEKIINVWKLPLDGWPWTDWTRYEKRERILITRTTHRCGNYFVDCYDSDPELAAVQASC